MSDYTPGPWHAGGTTVWGGPVTSARMTVADTACCGSLTRDEDEANAVLIAAAPELLKALVDCMADLDHYANTHGPGPDKRRDAAIAAIARAKGEVKA